MYIRYTYYRIDTACNYLISLANPILIHGIWFAIVSGMETIKQLKEILQINTIVTETELANIVPNTKRLVELSNHRALVKDLLISALELHIKQLTEVEK